MGKYITRGPFGHQVVKRRAQVLSNKQKALIHQVIVYSLTGKSKAAMMRDAGYGKCTAKNFYLVVRNPKVLAALQGFAKKLDKQKHMALARMSQTVHKATYAEAAKALDILIKAQRLIEGKSTENKAINVIIRNTDED